jgi:putative DNA primase/helicase
LVCRLDARLETPSERRFSGSPVADVQNNREKYVAAVLTILRAHALAGYPQTGNSSPMAGFSDWSRVVRGAITWLGLGDPVDSVSTVREDDPERQLRLTMMNCLATIFGFGMGRAATTAQIVRAASTADLNDTAELTDARAALSDALLTWERGGTVNSRSFGRWLMGSADVIIDGMAICGFTKNAQKMWFVDGRRG